MSPLEIQPYEFGITHFKHLNVLYDPKQNHSNALSRIIKTFIFKIVLHVKFRQYLLYKVNECE